MIEEYTKFDEDGFCVYQSVFKDDIINDLNSFSKTLKAQRGHDKKRKWYSWENVNDMTDEEFSSVDWAYHWSEHASNPSIDFIKKELSKYNDTILGTDNWVWYSCDFITLKPDMSFVRPHIDTPYRFSEFKYAEKHLGIQYGIPLDDVDELNGATGFVPNSHKYILDGKSIQNHLESWDIFFLDNYIQPRIQKGGFIMWNPRLLHSTMPNRTKEDRKMLLIHAADKKTSKRLMTVDASINSTLRK